MRARHLRAALPALVLAICAPVAAQSGTEKPEPPPEGTTWEQILAWYEEAKEKGEKVPSDVYAWIEQDLQRGGAWEYRIVRLADDSDEGLEAELNRLGAERWEVTWMERDKRELRLFLKRPGSSYLRNIPIPDLLRFLPLGSGDGN